MVNADILDEFENEIRLLKGLVSKESSNKRNH
jgi:hypothetical protein